MPLICLGPDTNASVREIHESFLDRATIDHEFYDVKDVWGSGQQQICNIWANMAVYNMNLWIRADANYR